MRIGILEKVGALQVLVYIYNVENEVLASDLVNNVNAGPTTIYNAINILLKEGFIQEEWKQNPRRRVFTLTEKGREIAKKLSEIETILKGGLAFKV